jgi:hypothetical protein
MSPSQTQRDSSRIDGRAIAAAALAVLLLIALASALVRLLSVRAGTATSATRSTAVQQQVPRLSRTDSTDELRHYQAAQAAWLNGYGWQDQAHAYAHIPIGRAMQLLLQDPGLAAPRATAPPLPSVGKPAPVDVPRTPDQPTPLPAPPLQPQSPSQLR